MTAADDALAAELRAELAEADQLARWRTQQALDEFELAWKEWRNQRGHVVPWTELQRRRGEGKRCWNCGASSPGDRDG